MKRQRGSALIAPKVQIHDQPPGKVLDVRLGVEKSRRDVGLIVHKCGKDELFLVCDVGATGRKTWMQWHARILPEQIDNLICCLTAARKEIPRLMGKSLS